MQIFEPFLNLMLGDALALHVCYSLHELLEELAPLFVLLSVATSPSF